MNSETASEAEVLRIAELLAQLGDSADQVATTIQQRGITGARNAVSILNPIVRYVSSILQMNTFGLDVTSGNTLRLTFFDGKTKQQEVPLPVAVISFLQAFNRGEYSALELRVQ